MVSIPHTASDLNRKEALARDAANVVINGIIGWLMFRGKDALPLTIDTISAHEKTVFSTGVMTFILPPILGLVAFFTLYVISVTLLPIPLNPP